MATGVTGAPVHSGSWFGLPDFGVTEWLQGTKSTSPQPQQQTGGYSQQTFSPDPNAGKHQTGVLGANTTQYPSGGGSSSGGNNSGGNSDLNTVIGNAAQSQQDAAAAAAEAARQAADRAYQAKKAAAETAKRNATDNYNWLIDTLGSNKQDTLKQVTENENTSLDAYAKNQQDTQAKYDGARQEILSTYRDLNLQQEKILRGSGQAQSSRSQEATLRLNNLMGKDLSGISTQNADAMAVIGNAIAAVKQKASDLSTQVETSTKQQLDKAALDYKSQIDAIDANTQLDDNARQDAYDQASAKLSSDTAAIQSWAAGLKVQAAQTAASLKDQLDGFITDNVDSQGNTTSSLSDLQKKSAGILASAQNTTLDQGSTIADPTQGVFQNANTSYATKDALDAAFQAGKLTPDEYQAQLLRIQSNVTPSTTAAAPIAAVPTATAGASTLPNSASITANVQSDPLLAAIFNNSGVRTA